jgi:hypothetical protein
MKDYHHINFEKKDWLDLPELRENPMLVIPLDMPNHRLLHQLVQPPIVIPQEYVPVVFDCMPRQVSVPQTEYLTSMAERLIGLPVSQAEDSLIGGYAINVVQQTIVAGIEPSEAHKLHQFITEPARMEKRGEISRSVKKDMRIGRIDEVIDLLGLANIEFKGL